MDYPVKVLASEPSDLNAFLRMNLPYFWAVSLNMVSSIPVPCTVNDRISSFLWLRGITLYIDSTVSPCSHKLANS